MKGRRYFIVYFTGVNDDNEVQKGKLMMFVEDGGYINQNYVHTAITDDYHIQEPFITNIDELSESDFHDFIANSTDADIRSDSNQGDFL